MKVSYMETLQPKNEFNYNRRQVIGEVRDRILVVNDYLEREGLGRGDAGEQVNEN